MSRLDGHCLCGNVTYTVDTEDPIMTGICHCRDCQRSTGTAYSIIAAVEIGEFHVEGASLKQFDTMGEDRKSPAHRNFCSNCGSQLFSILGDADDIVWIKAGTLNDASWLEPELEAWTDSAQPWALQGERDDRGYFPRGLDTD
ncbi:GFA family protein [Patulibacter sp. NPDC049589]|uniref:GFA family protein n=1 Tax=Patulibacter sp. NPDC049589 TaxID=3154731 RepID=UPI00342E11DB